MADIKGNIKLFGGEMAKKETKTTKKTTARKKTLVDFGFRLPCAKDNRPLKSEEFFAKVGQKIYISATPADFEKLVMIPS